MASKSVLRAILQKKWQPTDLGTSLVAWWNADDHGTSKMTDDGSGVISAWNDRIANVATSATTTARPTWGASSYNGLAGVTFDAVANTMTGTTLTALPTGATAGEVWCAFNGTSQAAISSMFVYGGAGAVARWLRRTSTNQPNVLDGTTSVTGSVNAANGYHVIGGNFSGTTMNGIFDGTLITGSPATTATLATSTSRIRIGAGSSSSASNFFLGVVRHCFVTLILTPFQRQQLEGWCAWDSKQAIILPSYHPFRSIAP